VRDLHRIACGDLEPDLTLLLDVEPEAGLARARGRGALNRMDDQAREFYRRVRAGYLEMARRSPERFRLLDASLGVDEVAARVWDVVASFLRL
ncbi:MAG: dTMP kinase, partial [Bryobacteraceae bacterium]